MTAVIRLKRLLDEEPLDAVVINCKRRKTNDAENELSTVLKFAGTLESQVGKHCPVKILTSNLIVV